MKCYVATLQIRPQILTTVVAHADSMQEAADKFCAKVPASIPILDIERTH